MNVLVLGASGATGREVVKRTLERGHTVTAFVRDPAKLGMSHAHLSVVVGDVTEFAAVERVVEHCDAVMSALGSGNSLKSDPALIDGIRNVVQAMEQTGVSRLVYLSMLGAGDSRGQLRFLDRYIVVPFVLRSVVADHTRKELLVRQSRLDWVIVRPPRLTNGAYTGRYRSGESIKERTPTASISRADVADFMAKQLTDDRYLRKAPAVLN